MTDEKCENAECTNFVFYGQFFSVRKINPEDKSDIIEAHNFCSRECADRFLESLDQREEFKLFDVERCDSYEDCDKIGFIRGLCESAANIATQNPQDVHLANFMSRSDACNLGSRGILRASVKLLDSFEKFDEMVSQANQKIIDNAQLNSEISRSILRFSEQSNNTNTAILQNTQASVTINDALLANARESANVNRSLLGNAQISASINQAMLDGANESSKINEQMLKHTKTMKQLTWIMLAVAFLTLLATIGNLYFYLYPLSHNVSTDSGYTTDPAYQNNTTSTNESQSMTTKNLTVTNMTMNNSSLNITGN